MDIGKIFTNLRIHRHKKRIILIKDLYNQCLEELAKHYMYLLVYIYPGAWYLGIYFMSIGKRNLKMMASKCI